MNSRTVQQLTDDELCKLKQSYVTENVGNPSYGELADSQDIPNEIIFAHYAGYLFSDDDFFCNQ